MSADDPDPAAADPAALDTSSEHLGVRVWAANGTTQQQLIDRIAVILGEHMDTTDELHITYNAMTNGSQAMRRPRLMRPGEPPWGDPVDGGVGAELVLQAGERERVHAVAGRSEIALGKERIDRDVQPSPATAGGLVGRVLACVGISISAPSR